MYEEFVLVFEVNNETYDQERDTKTINRMKNEIRWDDWMQGANSFRSVSVVIMETDLF